MATNQRTYPVTIVPRAKQDGVTGTAPRLTVRLPRAVATREAPQPRPLLWLRAHVEALWVSFIVLLGGAVHAINMFQLPYYENDEGTYMSQAWAVIHEGALAPYTYIYDHAPAGWLQIAGWVVLTHGLGTFGNAINSGRVLMLIFQLISIWLVYRIARNISGSVIVASLAALLFALSPFAVYYHRRVLIDNITTIWMLVSIALLVSRRLTLSRVWLSALALIIAILSKEDTIFLIPPLALLVGIRAHRLNRWFAVSGWTAIVGAGVSYYVLMAVLKGELFPQHTLLGGSNPHVSLIETLQWQASRSKDGGLLDPHSTFWKIAHLWVRDEPLLVVGGTLCALLSIILLLNQGEKERVIGALGLGSISIWVFFARGGVVLDFYLVPLIPMLALNVSLVLGVLLSLIRAAADHVKGRLARSAQTASTIFSFVAAEAILLMCLIGGLTSPRLGFAYDPRLLWNDYQSTAQQESISWVQRHIPSSQSIVVDDFMWTDLHDGANGAPVYPRAHWYWKLGYDTAIENGVFHHNWRNIDYVVTTPQLLNNVQGGPDAKDLILVHDAIVHSHLVAHFETGNWTVNVLKVNTGR